MDEPPRNDRGPSSEYRESRLYVREDYGGSDFHVELIEKSGTAALKENSDEATDQESIISG